MKLILGIILFVLVLSFAMMLMPVAIGGFIAYVQFSEGNVLGGIIAIIIGLLCEFIMWWFLLDGEVSGGYSDGECPYCGSGDTDGNHCYTCDDDF